MKLKVAWIDFETCEIGLSVPYAVIAERSWGKGELEVDIDTISTKLDSREILR